MSYEVFKVVGVFIIANLVVFISYLLFYLLTGKMYDEIYILFQSLSLAFFSGLYLCGSLVESLKRLVKVEILWKDIKKAVVYFVKLVGVVFIVLVPLYFIGGEVKNGCSYLDSEIFSSSYRFFIYLLSFCF